MIRSFSLDKINKNVLAALRKQGVTDDEIKRLLELNTISADGIYSEANLKFARDIVEKCFPIPSKGVKMRKILPWGASSSVTKVEPKVGGFVSQAEHCEIGSANQVINDYRLDYKGTQFSKNDGFAVIEYDNMGSPMRPYNSKDIDDVTKFDVPPAGAGLRPVPTEMLRPKKVE